MTQEDKQVLLKDLCERLPYGIIVKVEYYDASLKDAHIFEDIVLTIENINKLPVYWISAKPYLRPMSSMTEDEQRTLDSMCNGVEMVSRLSGLKMFDKAFDWLNAHHFDYRGLIPMGLAIEAPEDMYKFD